LTRRRPLAAGPRRFLSDYIGWRRGASFVPGGENPESRIKPASNRTDLFLGGGAAGAARRREPPLSAGLRPLTDHGHGRREPPAVFAAVDSPPRSELPEAIDADTFDRALQSAAPICLNRAVLRQMEPPRIASRFDPVATAHVALDDPAIMWAILGRAARQGWCGQDADPAEAIGVIGPSGIGSLIEQLRDAPQPEAAILPTLRREYRHAMVAARLAAIVGPAFGVPARVAAMAGLLHDIGRILMLCGRIGEHVGRVHRFAASSALGATYLEQALLGGSHESAGHAACQRIKAPAIVAGACLLHGRTAAERRRLVPQQKPLATLLGLCDAMANAFGFTAHDAIELRQAPTEASVVMRRSAAEIVTTLAAATEAADQRHGEMPPVPRALQGTTVALIGPRVADWTPLSSVLTRAGAEVRKADGLWAVAGANVVVIDALEAPLLPAEELLRGMARMHAAMPAVVVADRCHEPAEVVGELLPRATCCVTPLREAVLIERVVGAMQPRQRSASGSASGSTSGSSSGSSSAASAVSAVSASPPSSGSRVSAA
jgi:hypothetical protein